MIDNRLTFYNDLKNLCQKIANKLNALTRIAPYLNHNQIRLIYNSFLRDSLAIALLFGHFVLGVQIILLTNFKQDFNPNFTELLEMAIKAQYTLEI